jgi:single-strand DNA-binding protein
MAGETIITVVGNLTADPELRFTQNGLAVTNFTIASTPREFDRQANEWKDGEPIFLRASAWRDFAQNIANTLVKGSRVIAQGELKIRQFTRDDNTKGTSVELNLSGIGPELRYATATVQRTSGGSGGQQGQQQQGQVQGGSYGGNQGAQGAWAGQGQQQQQGADAWSTPGGNYGDETPF